MSKNQINYLLALATFVVIWLYFNTFFEGVMAQKNSGSTGIAHDRMAMSSRGPRSHQDLSNLFGNRSPYATQNPQPVYPYGRKPATFVPSSLVEMQKKLEAKQGKAVPSEVKQV